ncbi:acyltransferase [Rhodococcus globerulus]|uniref:acyltransferase family protein n=1 Tax=Rhodococcus globerulus TaxID=33008 RepID=UPI0030195864
MTEQAADTATVKPPKQRDISIQSLRGLAVLLMVAGHVIGSSAGRGMDVADDSVWRYFYLGLEDIRMPLFTVISGYVYAMRPVRSRVDLPELVRGKSRRLLLPMLTVGLLLFGMKLVVPDVNSRPEMSDLWRIYLFGYEHLWFLQAIFIIFLSVAALDALSMLSTPRRWALCTAVTLALFVALRLPLDINVFSINGAIRLLPFFLIGYGMQRHGLLDLRGRGAALTVGVFAVIYGFRLVIIFDYWNPNQFVVRAFSLAIGVLGVVLIYSARTLIKVPALAWIGGFSFGVYLLHVFGSAGARIALGKIGVSNDLAVFAICLAVGVGAPIAFQLVTGRWNPVRVLMLGEKPIRS